MDLWQLHIFCKVVECKSFSKAGEAVHLSQPTVSSHIKDLEEHCGCRLIDRLGRSTAPTKAGMLLYDYANRLIKLKAEAESALAEYNGEMRGHLVIGGSTIPGGYILPKIIGRFYKEYPEITVTLQIGDTGQIIKDTLAGGLEMGIVGARSTETRVVQEQLIADEMLLIVPATHKWRNRKSIPFDTLKNEPFIMREAGSGTRTSLSRCFSAKGYQLNDLHIIAEMGNTTAVCQAIKSEMGISILSTLAVEDDLKAGKLVALPLSGMKLQRHFYLTYHRNRTASPICGRFIAFLKQTLPPHFNTV